MESYGVSEAKHRPYRGSQRWQIAKGLFRHWTSVLLCVCKNKAQSYAEYRPWELANKGFGLNGGGSIADWRNEAQRMAWGLSNLNHSWADEQPEGLFLCSQPYYKWLAASFLRTHKPLPRCRSTGVDAEANKSAGHYLGLLLGDFDCFLSDQQIPSRNQDEVEVVR